MSEDLRNRIIAYRSSMAVFKYMLNTGIINEEEYAKIDTIIAQKYDVSLSTIFR